MSLKDNIALCSQKIMAWKEGRERNPFYYKLFLLLAFLIFALGIALSIRGQPYLVENVYFFPLCFVVFFLTPLNICIMTWELQSSARVFGRDISFLTALRITLIASIANFLPLPGALVVKMSYFRKIGIALKDSGILSVLIAFLWLGSAFIYSGLAFLAIKNTAYDVHIVAFILCVMGVVLLGLTVYVAVVLYKNTIEILLQIGLRFLMLINGAARLLLCCIALGIESDFASMSVLTLSRALAALFVMVPSGIGVSEIFSGLIALSLELPMSSGYLAAALDRILDMVFLCLAIVCAYIFKQNLLIMREAQKDEKN